MTDTTKRICDGCREDQAELYRGLTAVYNLNSNAIGLFCSECTPIVLGLVDSLAAHYKSSARGAPDVQNLDELMDALQWHSPLTLRRYDVRPPNSINRHSCRLLRFRGGQLVTLDRTLDGAPPFYTATDDGRPIPKHIPVDGKDYWGDGLSWTAATEKLRETMGAGEPK